MDHIAILQANFQHFVGRRLIDTNAQGKNLSQAVFEANFAVISHNSEADPIFNYANRVALELFEMDWEDFIRMPSRLSAEATNRAERDKLLSRVTKHNFIDDYSGIRISASGQRFQIEHAVVWNLYHHNQYYGQAAMFSQWKML